MRQHLCRLIWVLAVSLASSAHAQPSGESAPGVNPKDNITKVEVLYKYDHFDLAGSINSLTFKYDQALDQNWGFNAELPFVTFDGFGVEEAGLGDLQARVRYVTSMGQLSLLGGAELVMPTASDDVLGRGRWQANPVIGAVYMFSQTTFMFAGYKHFFSFAGDEDRPDISESQPRLILGYTDLKGWWLLSDTKYTKSWESDDLETLDVEAELGQMIGPTTGMWVRAGTSFLDSDREFGINLGLRNIF
jgi:hypothetical protein